VEGALGLGSFRFRRRASALRPIASRSEGEAHARQRPRDRQALLRARFRARRRRDRRALQRRRDRYRRRWSPRWTRCHPGLADGRRLRVRVHDHDYGQRGARGWPVPRNRAARGQLPGRYRRSQPRLHRRRWPHPAPGDRAV